MRRIRVIPVLLVQNGGLVKSVQFKNYRYIGDPINAVKIFNDKEVDEIVILDISATAEKRPPNRELIKNITGEAFMPLAYGGGVTKLDEVKELIQLGVEKIIFNSAARTNPSLIEQAAKWAGSQSIVVSMDACTTLWGGYKLYSYNGRETKNTVPLVFAKEMEAAGAGEIFLQQTYRDGTFKGFDLKIIEMISRHINIPLVAAGGAGSIEDFRKAVEAGAAAVAAGSMFVLQRPHHAVLISYPSQDALQTQLFSRIS